VDEIEDRRRDRGGATEPETEHHVADLRDDVERHDSFHVRLRDRADDADQHREGSHDQHEAVELARKEQRLHADEAVDADFREQAGEHRAHRTRSRGVRVGQPEEQRKHRRLDAEGEQQEQLQSGAHAVWQCGEPRGQLGHVHRAGRGEDQADGDDEHHRLDDVEHHIGGAGANLGVGAFEREQHVARHQQNLERDEQVEEIAGEERLRDSCRQHHVHRVVERRLLVGAALTHRIHEHRGDHRQGDDHHHRGETIGHHRDGEVARPPSETHHMHRTVSPRVHQYGERGSQRSRERTDADRALREAVPGNQHHRRRDERHEHGQRNQRRHVATSSACGWSPGLALRSARDAMSRSSTSSSTSSSSVMVQLRQASASMNASRANPMTIAVSTSA